MTGSQAGAILAAAGLAPLLGTSDRRLRTAGFAAWAAGVLVMAADLLHKPIASIRVDASSRPAVAAAPTATTVDAAA